VIQKGQLSMNTFEVDRAALKAMRSDLERHYAVLDEIEVHKVRTARYVVEDVAASATQEAYALLVLEELEFYFLNVPLLDRSMMPDAVEYEARFAAKIYAAFLQYYRHKLRPTPADDTLGVASVMLHSKMGCWSVEGLARDL
jgi:hypothetical protein